MANEPEEPEDPDDRRRPNHLDKIYKTYGAFFGVQLKKNSASYQVEAKLKGVKPARNVGFGGFTGSLEEAKRGYNYGVRVVEGPGAKLHEFPGDDNTDPMITAGRSLEYELQMRAAVIAKNKPMTDAFKKHIKEYARSMNPRPDSEEHLEKVRRFWLKRSLQDPASQHKMAERWAKKAPQSKGQDDNNGDHDDRDDQDDPIINWSDNSIPAVRQGDHSSAFPNLGPNHVDNHQPIPTSVLDDSSAAVTQRQPDLPRHAFGVTAHGGDIISQEYRPQINLDGVYVSPCFFNHNFNLRTARRENYVSGYEKSLEKYHYKAHDSDAVNVVWLTCSIRVLYNYDARECAHDNFQTPFTTRLLDENGDVVDVSFNDATYNYQDDDDINVVMPDGISSSVVQTSFIQDPNGQYIPPPSYVPFSNSHIQYEAAPAAGTNFVQVEEGQISGGNGAHYDDISNLDLDVSWAEEFVPDLQQYFEAETYEFGDGSESNLHDSNMD